MRFRSLICTSMALFSAVAYAGAENPSAKFTASQETMVPGTTLRPGNYSIHVLDHLQDRYIVRIDRSGSASHETFIGVPASSLLGAGGSGAVLWKGAPEGKAAMRGFNFGNGATSIEFVYPKNDAVALAKLNDEKVLAVDPASEGRPAQISSLSKNEMEMVTLWMLSTTRVGSTDGAGPQIKAEKLQLVASVKPPRPPLARLPHTASSLPLVSLIGLFSATGGAILARRRSRRQTA